MARRDPVDRPVARGSDGGVEAGAYAERARRLGLPFAPAVELGAGARTGVEAIKRGAIAIDGPGGAVFIAPEEEALPGVAHWLIRHPTARRRLYAATPTAIRSALIAAGARGFVANAVGRLATLYPDLSARQVATGGQIAAGIVAAAGIVLALALAPVATLVAVNLVGAVFFFGISVLRFVAAEFAGRRKLAEAVAPVDDGELPVYTVLVPLLHEAHLVGDLVDALDRIDWPRDRLDIKLIVEADDPATAAAAKRVAGAPPYEVIVVPAAAPRTKPKALAFALPFARGAFVTVYDAEDQPHPQQLRQAFAVFSRSDAGLACLQSVLVVENRRDGLIARLFAIEYSALFDGLLPTLSALGMPLPLGGTSNHFRREALDAVGGWDPFNVTEDADLGLRLARFGYRSATIDLPTLEEAPAALGPWLNQRTRWFKGWLQTWLVHMRRPLRLARELGWRGLLGFNLVGTAVIVSALIHPLYLFTLALAVIHPMLLWGDGGLLAAMVLGLNIFNLCAGYVAMGRLATRSLRLRSFRREGRALFALPFYWLLISLASYRALVELVLRPHHWEKTPHRGRRIAAQ